MSVSLGAYVQAGVGVPTVAALKKFIDVIAKLKCFGRENPTETYY